jgi:hypothetical protein
MLRQRVDLDAALTRQALEAAERARDLDRVPDAVEVLRVALTILEEAGADRLTRLRAMSVYSRMVSAIMPLPPPKAAAFSGTRLRLVTSLGAFVHRFLVGTEERFRLILLTLSLGVGLVLRGGRRSVAAVEAAPAEKRNWEDFTREVGDFETLDAHHLTAFEALVASLSAVDRGGRMAVWDRILGDAR